MLRDESINLIVSKNSGGTATYSKIEAARALRIPVVMIDRPHKHSVPTVPRIEDVLHKLEVLLSMASDRDLLSHGETTMRKLYLIGIGAGNPEYITVQAINALNKVDVFFFMDKGDAKQDLVALRKEICERYIENRSYRIVETADPIRDPAILDYTAE